MADDGAPPVSPPSPVQDPEPPDSGSQRDAEMGPPLTEPDAPARAGEDIGVTEDTSAGPDATRPAAVGASEPVPSSDAPSDPAQTASAGGGSEDSVETAAPETAAPPTAETAATDGGGAETAGAATTESGAEQSFGAADADDIALLGPAILERLESLERLVAESAGIEQHQATLIQKLHAENVTLREGELTQALKPLILDLARLHDDVASVIARGGEELRKAAVIPELILDVLDRHGVSQISPAPGDPFDGKQHQGVKGVPTADAALDATIESVIRLGFIRDGAHLVRPAQVAVYRHTPPAQESADLTSDAQADPASDFADASPVEATSTNEQPERDGRG